MQEGVVDRIVVGVDILPGDIVDIIDRNIFPVLLNFIVEFPIKKLPLNFKQFNHSRKLVGQNRIGELDG